MKNLNQLLLEFDYKQNFKDEDFYVSNSNYYTYELINKCYQRKAADSIYLK